eukprot:TRINITY_DN11527_c0_g1_i1.p1 TRINITY_DN11527_c0_g1~~TRINITY_DN11527_c0_g1_i1.p1  ORF type:complete len:264 (-),score=52.26 TRINITY_DN11527_c0_g1_i1:31-822(-)
MCRSEQLKIKATNKLAEKLSEKIEEKHLEGLLKNMNITSLSLGTKNLVIDKVALEPSTNGDLAVDFDLSYTNGDAKMGLSALVLKVNVDVIATLVSVKGRMHLRCAPFPTERFSLSFREEPSIEVDLQFIKGPNLFQNKIRDFIIDKVKISLSEKFVAPNRKYFRIPTLPKTDPLRLKERRYHINTFLTDPSSQEGEMGSDSSLEISSEEEEHSFDEVQLKKESVVPIKSLRRSISSGDLLSGGEESLEEKSEKKTKPRLIFN